MVQLDSPTVSQGSSLWTQKSVLERQNKTKEKKRLMLDDRKAKSPDFSHVSFKDLSNVSNDAQIPNSAIKSQEILL